MKSRRKEVIGMRLYASEKEAQVLQIALAHFVADEMDESEIAQALLARIARCLELQGAEQKPYKR